MYTCAYCMHARARWEGRTDSRGVWQFSLLIHACMWYIHTYMYITGTDEHGQKIAQTAEGLGVAPIDLCNKYAGAFQVRTLCMHSCMRACAYVISLFMYMCTHVRDAASIDFATSTQMYFRLHSFTMHCMCVSALLKLIGFELAAKFSRRGENQIPFNHVCATRKTQFSNGSKRGFPFGRDLRRPTQTQSALTSINISTICVYQKLSTRMRVSQASYICMWAQTTYVQISIHVHQKLNERMWHRTVSHIHTTIHQHKKCGTPQYAYLCAHTPELNHHTCVSGA